MRGARERHSPAFSLLVAFLPVLLIGSELSRPSGHRLGAGSLEWGMSLEDLLLRRQEVETRSAGEGSVPTEAEKSQGEIQVPTTAILVILIKDLY